MNITIGDIVQIVNEEHRWYPCLIVVTELKSFGIQGYTVIPTNDDKPNGQAYIRLREGEYEKVGSARIYAE